jgi:long-subunit acyl-CoA synthetase (AMP-forming)
MSLSHMPIEPGEINMTCLSQRYLHLSADISQEYASTPNPDDHCIYVFTSSATSIKNLKCVPVSHRILVKNGRGQIKSLQKHFPGLPFQNLRVLGWSPLSHIMSICLDFGVYVLLTAGCYIYGLTPICYDPSTAPIPGADYDISSLLLQTIEQERPDVFAAVPWMMEGFKKAFESKLETEREKMISALRGMKLIVLGGAPLAEETSLWSAKQKLPTLTSIGMTEIGGT